ncbi:MAG: hypothetical protein ACT4PZ_22055 [Panacagrimonas sp.]
MNLSIHFNVLAALVSLSFGFPSYMDTSGSMSHGIPWGIDISTSSHPPKEDGTKSYGFRAEDVNPAA